MPPPSRASSPPATIASRLLSVDPPIVLLTVAGRLTLPAIQNASDFRDVVRSLGGRPYRVLCDFTQMITMPEDVCNVFMRGQEFAVERGMERDAFACTSSVLRLQFVRIARESGRFDRLGPIQFFDTLEQARAYLEMPASRTFEVASSRRTFERGPVSRRTPLPEAEAAPPSRRLILPELGAGPVSRRAPAPVDLGEGASRRPPPFSLRAAAPSRPHNKG